MVRKLDVKDESFYTEGVNALLVNDAVFIEELKGLEQLEIFKCGVNQMPAATGYLVKRENNCIAYIVVESLALPGVCGYMPVRGWVAEGYRGSGLYQKLLKVASSSKPLISDRDGVTEAAYKSWMKAEDFTHKFYDQCSMKIVSSEDVPENEKFASGAVGNRWLLVMEPI